MNFFKPKAPISQVTDVTNDGPCTTNDAFLKKLPQLSYITPCVTREFLQEQHHANDALQAALWPMDCAALKTALLAHADPDYAIDGNPYADENEAPKRYYKPIDVAISLARTQRNYEPLILLLEAGAKTPHLSPDIIYPASSPDAAITNLLIVAGAKLPSYEKGKFHKTYPERIEAGLFPMPTVERLEQDYGIVFDLEKRNTNRLIHAEQNDKCCHTDRYKKALIAELKNSSLIL